MPRHVTSYYRDPLEVVWMQTLTRLGLRLTRDPDTFASTDGRGTLNIAPGETLDADDSLAQMIFHEICHSLIAGDQGFETADWGIDDPQDEETEHATQRLQAALCDLYGLREALASTTDFRVFYDALGHAPLPRVTSPDVTRARLGLRRSFQSPWHPHVHKALQASRDIFLVAKEFDRSKAAVWSNVGEAAFWEHETMPLTDKQCGDCGWFDGSSCLSWDVPRDKRQTACFRHEPAIDCEDCGACCREAYHSVTLADNDDTAHKHPLLTVVRDGYTEMQREGNRCVALHGDGNRAAYRCTIYSDRPTSCREFERGGANCLIARRRVGLSL